MEELTSLGFKEIGSSLIDGTKLYYKDVNQVELEDLMEEIWVPDARIKNFSFDRNS